MSIVKKYLKTKPQCNVSFKLNAKQCGNAKRVFILGDFTDWEDNPLEMRKVKGGSFTRTVKLDKDSTYEFRYRDEEGNWFNDAQADEYKAGGIGDEENGVLTL